MRILKRTNYLFTYKLKYALLPFLKETESASNTLEQSKVPEFHIFLVLVLDETKVLPLISNVSDIAEVSEILVFKLSCQISVNSHLPSKFGQSLVFLQEVSTKKQNNKVIKNFMVKCSKND